MIQSKTCVRLLIGIHLVLGVFTAVFANLGLIPYSVFKSSVIGVLLGQAILVGLWTGLSSCEAPPRFIKGLFAAALIWAFGVMACRGAQIPMFLWLVVPWAAVAIAASFLRRYGTCCVTAETALTHSGSEAIRFSLRQMAISIAIFAVLLSLVRGSHNAGPALTIASFLLAACAFGIGFTVQALACLWAALGAGAWPRRLWLPMVLALVWAPLSAFAVGGHPQQFLQIGEAVLLCISLVLISLLAVRFAGYRLVHHPAVYSALENRLETEIA